MRRLRKERGKPLTLKVTIPAKIVPLFLAFGDIMKEPDKAVFASKAICRFLVSSEAMSAFDEYVNTLEF